MSGGGQVIADPHLTVGPYRVLQRVDSKWILVHPDLPPDGSICALRSSKDAIVAEAHRLVGLGSPVVIMSPPAAAPRAAPTKTAPKPRTDDGGGRKRARPRSRLSSALLIGDESRKLAAPKKRPT